MQSLEALLAADDGLVPELPAGTASEMRKGPRFGATIILHQARGIQRADGMTAVRILDVA